MKNNIRSVFASVLVACGASYFSTHANAFVTYERGERAKTTKSAYQPASAIVDTAQLFPTADSAKSARPLNLRLPSGKSYEIARATVLPGYAGARTFVGYFASHGEDYRVYLSEVNGAISGFMLSPEGSITVAPQANQTVNAVTITNSKTAGHSKAISFVPDALHPPRDRGHIFDRADDRATQISAYAQELGVAEQVAKAQRDVAKAGNTVIDIMVLYSPAMVTRHSTASGVVARITSLVAAMNDALTNSQVTLTMRVVHTKQVAVSDTASNIDTLNAISPGSTNATLKSEIDTLRNQYGADLVTLLRPYQNSLHGNCGIAWILGGPGSVPISDAPNGFSVVSDGTDVGGSGYYCTDLTLAHELGHNLGLLHHSDTPTSSDISLYARGYVNSAAGFATIMASTPIAQIARYSNPDITCQGAPCGIAAGQPGQANAAASIRLSMAGIAAFRAAPAVASPQDAFLKGDFNGDGRTDIVYTSGTTGDSYMWLMNGTTRTSSTFIWPGSTGWRITHVADFNGDGKSDLLWYNINTKETAIWLMNSSSSLSAAIIFGAGTAWKVTHVGDLNGDGKADLVWFNSDTKETASWLMNGTSVASFAYLFSGGTEWRVTHLADLNADGKQDLVWYNSATKETAVWLMNGLVSSKAVFIFGGGTDWKVTHAGDLNGDGKADLIWYNSGTKETAAWLMNGSDSLGAVIVFGGGTGWRVVDVSDLNGDGKADLIWTNTLTTQGAIWTMNGLNSTSAVFSYTGGDASVLFAADLNGDGRSDLVWRDSVNGAVSVWLMNGTTATATAVIGP